MKAKVKVQKRSAQKYLMDTKKLGDEEESSGFCLLFKWHG